MTSTALVPSKELLDTIAEARTKYYKAKDLVVKAYELAIRDGFSPKDARTFLLAELPFLSESTIRKSLPAEAKDQSKVRSDLRYSLPQNIESDSPKIVNITTKAEIKDADLVSDEIPPNLPTKTSEQFYKEQQKPFERTEALGQAEVTKEQLENEEPTELDLANIKIAQLEDALHKTEQFKPAIQLQERKEFDEWFEFLKKTADGVNTFYYDAYGIDLFKNRELTQLKNSGVKTFKRLYFEV